MAETYQSLSTTTQDGVLTLTLLGPGKGNAMGLDFWAELPLAIDEINRMNEVRAVVVRGSDDHFSYGLDLPQMMPKLAAMVNGNQMADRRRELMDMIRQMQSGFQKMHESPKPFIAAVHGWCIGGGLNMISAADIRLCSSKKEVLTVVPLTESIARNLSFSASLELRI